MYVYIYIYIYTCRFVVLGSLTQRILVFGASGANLMMWRWKSRFSQNIEPTILNSTSLSLEIDRRIQRILVWR